MFGSRISPIGHAIGKARRMVDVILRQHIAGLERSRAAHSNQLRSRRNRLKRPCCRLAAERDAEFARRHVRERHIAGVGDFKFIADDVADIDVGAGGREAAGLDDGHARTRLRHRNDRWLVRFIGRAGQVARSLRTASVVIGARSCRLVHHFCCQNVGSVDCIGRGENGRDLAGRQIAHIERARCQARQWVVDDDTP